LRPNQVIKIKAEHDRLEQLTLMLPNNESLVIRRTGNDYITELHGAASTIIKNELASATIQGSLYSTAKRMGIPYSLIEQMTTIFHGAINFRRDVRAGDQFTILYSASYKNNRLIKIGNILAVSFTHQGTTYQAIRHEVSKNQFDYFTPQGSSLKQSFSRYPVQFTHISSMFSLSRMHPMLHYRRPHQGVDLAAPMGTPVYATGDGRIEQISHQSGYGNLIKISHQRVYSSIYAHLLRFQKGLSKGDFVKRGQLIGYVGRTGLADGPHCHYEFHINHLPHNPSTVTLPHAALPQRNLAAFKTRANQLMSQLKRYELAQMNKHTTPTKTL
jgi:murein DD-endopeptidase MepM/ murein hydrolase activator NlpD